MTNRRPWVGAFLPVLLAVCAVLVVGARAHAQDFVGWVSTLEGAAEVQRAGAAAWAPLSHADGLGLGDQIRTLAESRMKILLRDDSLLTLGESSQLRLDEQVVGEAPVSTFQLLFGTIRAIATERYGAAGARFEVKTPTAIAGVRGTEFVAAHDAAKEETLVVGVVDTTVVRAIMDAAAERAVRLGPGQSTRVRRGSYPSPAATMPAEQLKGLIDATAARGGDFDAKGGKKAAVQAEPRLPTRPGDRDGSPVERVVDAPFVRDRGPKRPAPPPPPPPGN